MVETHLAGLLQKYPLAYVGYQNLETAEAVGARMTAVPFIVVGAAEGSEGFWLSDLKPTGYLDNGDLSKKGTDGDFAVQLLNENGFPVDTYSWKHTAKKGEWNNDAHWNDPSATEITPHEKGSDYFFKMGEGLWIYRPDNSDDDPTAIYTVNSAGQVCTKDVVWKLASVAGAVAVANPYPVAIKLSSLKVEGYIDNSDLAKKGTDGDFAVQLLDAGGFPTATYSWKHTSKKGEWNNDAHWNDPSATPVVPNSENDLTIEPGQGLWIYAPDRSDDDPGADYTITVKCPVLL